MNFISQSEDDTINHAKELASALKPNDVILLHGNLGMGKSVFARALIRSLCNNPDLEVVSPTFTLVQTYNAPIASISHYDLYRIEDPEEIFELGWEDSLNEGITIVEWPERLGPCCPSSYLDITITNTHNNENQREILIKRV